MKLEDKKRILIIRLSSLGDVILTSPVLRSIKNKYPDIEIDYIVKPGFSEAIKYNPNISNIFYYSNDEEEQTAVNSALRDNNYDLILDLQNNKRSKKIVKYLKKPVVKYKKQSIKRFLFVQFKMNRKKLKELPQVPEKYVMDIEDLELDNNGPDIFLPDDLSSNLPTNKKYVGLCPGSMHITKMWPIENFIEVGKKLNKDGYTLLLFGGKDDITVCKYISIYVKDSINCSTNNELLKMTADMKMCEYIICNDSGLMHTACAAKVPVIAIFGSTVKEFGFAPYNSQSKVVENEDLKCRPCSHIGKDKCPKNHFNCMRSITPERIIEEIKELA